MKTLIYSDVHGNLPAFEAMLEDVGPFDASICLGDLVDYGPWSNECVDLAVSLNNPVLIMGNHEEAFINQSNPFPNGLAQIFLNFCLSGFDRIEIISKFVENFQAHNHCFCHTLNNQHIYPDTKIELTNNHVIGHSHHQFQYNNNGFALLNPGSVGQNRKYINLVDYMIFDSTTNQFEFRSIPYNFSYFIDKLKSQKYPAECIDYYLSKKQY